MRRPQIKIKEELVKGMHELKQQTGDSVTQQANDAIAMYLRIRIPLEQLRTRKGGHRHEQETRQATRSSHRTDRS